MSKHLTWLLVLHLCACSAYHPSAQSVEYFFLTNGNADELTIGRTPKGLIVNEIKRSQTRYSYHVLNPATMAPLRSATLQFPLPVSNQSGVTHIISDPTGQLIVMGRRPGGETFVSAWSADPSNPLWAYQLKSGDSPFNPRRALYLSASGHIVVVDLLQISTREKRLFVTAFQSDGTLFYTYSYGRDGYSFDCLSSASDGTTLYVNSCAADKSNSALLHIDLSTGDILQTNYFQGVHIRGISLQSDSQLLYIAGTERADQYPFVACLPLPLQANATPRWSYKIQSTPPLINPEMRLLADSSYPPYLFLQPANDTIVYIIELLPDRIIQPGLMVFTYRQLSATVIGQWAFLEAIDPLSEDRLVLRIEMDHSIPSACDFLRYCFDREPLSIQMQSGEEFQKLDGDVPGPLTLTAGLATGSFQSTCLTVEKGPTPRFRLDRDRFCIGECVLPIPINNDKAESWKWRLLLYGMDTLWSTSPQPPCLTLNRAGLFVLSHQIRYRTCIYEYQLPIRVSNESVDFDLPDTVLCPEDSLRISLPAKFQNIRWSDGDTTHVKIISSPGRYTFEAQNSAGCPLHDSFTVQLFTPQSVRISPRDTTICDDASLQLSLPPFPSTRYLWNTGDTTPHITVADSGVYSVIVLNTCGTLYDTVSVHLRSCNVTVYIPNVFSPNGDGSNDRWEPFPHNATILSIRIFDRWGNLLYSHPPAPRPWDGSYHNTPLPPNVYTYVIQCQSTIDPNNQFTLTGTVTIVR